MCTHDLCGRHIYNRTCGNCTRQTAEEAGFRRVTADTIKEGMTVHICWARKSCKWKVKEWDETPGIAKLYKKLDGPNGPFRIEYISKLTHTADYLPKKETGKHHRK